jgi:hypothetical protein
MALRVAAAHQAKVPEPPPKLAATVYTPGGTNRLNQATPLLAIGLVTS